MVSTNYPNEPERSAEEHLAEILREGLNEEGAWDEITEDHAFVVLVDMKPACSIDEALSLVVEMVTTGVEPAAERIVEIGIENMWLHKDDLVQAIELWKTEKEGEVVAVGEDCVTRTPIVHPELGALSLEMPSRSLYYVTHDKVLETCKELTPRTRLAFEMSAMYNVMFGVLSKTAKSLLTNMAKIVVSKQIDEQNEESKQD